MRRLKIRGIAGKRLGTLPTDPTLEPPPDIRKFVSDLSANFVVVKVHEGAHVADAVASLSIAVRRVDETLGKPQSVLYVVAAAAPLPAVRGRVALAARVARAVRQVAGATRFRHGVRDSGACRRIDECRLLRTYSSRYTNKTKRTISPKPLSPN